MLEFFGNAAHLLGEIGTLRIVPCHLYRALAERVGDAAFVDAGLAQDHRHGVAQAIQSEAGADGASIPELGAVGAPGRAEAALGPRLPCRVGAQFD